MLNVFLAAFWLITALQAALFFYRLVFSENDRRKHHHATLLTLEGILKLSIRQVVKLASRTAFNTLNKIYGEPHNADNIFSYFTLRSFRASFLIAFFYIILLPLISSVMAIVAAALVSIVEDGSKLEKSLMSIGVGLSWVIILALVALGLRRALRGISRRDGRHLLIQLRDMELLATGYATNVAALFLVATITISMSLVQLKSVGSSFPTDWMGTAIVVTLICLLVSYVVIFSVGVTVILFRYGIKAIALGPAIYILNAARIVHYAMIALGLIFFCLHVNPEIKFADNPDAETIGAITQQIAERLEISYDLLERNALPLFLVLFFLAVAPYLIQALTPLKSTIFIFRIFLAAAVLVEEYLIGILRIIGISTGYVYILAVLAFVVANAIGDSISASISRYIFWLIANIKKFFTLLFHFIFDLSGALLTVFVSSVSLIVLAYLLIYVGGLVDKIANPTVALSRENLQESPYIVYLYWGGIIALVYLGAMVLLAGGFSLPQIAANIDFTDHIFLSGMANSTEGMAILVSGGVVLAGFLTTLLPTIFNVIVLILFIVTWVLGSMSKRLTVYVARFLVCPRVTEKERVDRIETVLVGATLTLSTAVLFAIGMIGF